MTEKLSESDVLADMDRLRDAIALIRKHYPQHVLTLVPAHDVHYDKNASQTGTDAGSQPAGAAARGADSVRKRTGTNREQVCAVCRGKWVSSRDIIELTGLSVKQVEGVVSGKGMTHLFERRPLPGADRTGKFGPVQYRLKESADEKPKHKT